MNQQTRVRRTAALAAGALASTTLVTAALAVTSAPAQAASVTGSFDWEISQQYDDHLSTHELDGVTENAEGVLSFPAVSSSVDPASGVGTVQYDGSVKGSFVNAGSPFYWVKIEDPAVSVAADGEGQITAVVSAWNTGAMGSTEATTAPARVVVTTFDAAGTWSTGSIAAIPDWAGVLPEGPGSVALGIGAGKPVDGKSFAPAFLAQTTSGVRAHFYSSGAGSDPKKAPSAFTASFVAAPPAVSRTVTATASYRKQSIALKVAGAGFTASDGQPGDDGVYVGLAPAGGMPATGAQSDMEKFVASNWVPGSAISGGVLATSLTASVASLKKGTSYALYTWRAHSHSSTSQDTETAVSLDWSKLTATSKVTAKVAKKPTTKKAGKLRVAVKGGTLKAAGKVVVTLKKGKVTKTKKATLKKGAAAVALPKLNAGKWKVTVAFTASDDTYSNGKKVLSVKVAKPKKK